MGRKKTGLDRSRLSLSPMAMGHKEDPKRSSSLNPFGDDFDDDEDDVSENFEMARSHCSLDTSNDK